MVHPRHHPSLEVERHLGLLYESLKGLFECRVMWDIVLFWSIL